MYENNIQEIDKNTYCIVICVAFLIGVPENNLLDIPENSDLLQSLWENDKALVIRALCSIRTKLLTNWQTTEYDLKYSLINLDRQKLYKQDILTLSEKNIVFTEANYSTNQYIIKANKIIAERIDSVKELFPSWIVWDYIKRLFIMPNGETITGLKNNQHRFLSRINDYPFQKYINFPSANNGNILFTDEKFIKALYKHNGSEFTNFTNLIKAPVKLKTDIYNFIARQEKVIIAVDCENSDVFKLASVLKQLNNATLKKIQKIVMFDDVHTTSAWKYLSKIIDVPTEYVLVERVKESKSLVDMKICAEVTKERYKNNVQAFILASSDSDYWGLISSLDNTDFLVLIEEGKCGKDIKRALMDNGIYYCNMDKFGTSPVADVRLSIIDSFVRQSLEGLQLYNLKELLTDCYKDLKINIAPEEKESLYKRYSSKIGIKLCANGDYVFDLKNI